jgi:hypothetical protein
MTVSGAAMMSRPGDLKPAFGTGRGPIGRLAAGWLCLAAAPTFACMALLSALGNGQPNILCGAMQHASPLSGMTLMCLLMSAFHMGPWLKLIGGR